MNGDGVGAGENAPLTVEQAHRFLGILLNNEEAGASNDLAKLSESDRSRLQERVVKAIIKNYLPPELQEKDWCQPLLEKFVPKILTQAMSAHPHPEAQKPFVVYGKTQSGKTGLKSIISALCLEMKFINIVITNGVTESRELTSKLKTFAKGCSSGNLEERIIPLSAPKGQRLTAAKLTEVARKHLSTGMTIVAADTGAQLRKLRLLLESLWESEMPERIRRKFVMVVDEADAMHRTKDDRQLLEQEYSMLMAMKPQMTVMVAATPVPL